MPWRMPERRSGASVLGRAIAGTVVKRACALQSVRKWGWKFPLGAIIAPHETVRTRRQARVVELSSIGWGYDAVLSRGQG